MSSDGTIPLNIIVLCSKSFQCGSLQALDADHPRSSMCDLGIGQD